MLRFQIRTNDHFDAVDITRQVREAVGELGISSGLLHVHCPHTTGSIVVNESADPDVMRDILASWARLVPRDGGYRHAEGNSQAHILSSLAGCGVTLPVEEGKPALGTWQGIFFLELDGPRRREVWVTCVSSE